MTNQGYGALGSYSIIFGSLGNSTPFDFIKEIQVKTGGYEAEYGQSTGGVVNVVTKSGSNNFRGSLFGYARPGALQADFKEYQSTNGTVQIGKNEQSDAGIEISGPIDPEQGVLLRRDQPVVGERASSRRRTASRSRASASSSASART